MKIAVFAPFNAQGHALLSPWLLAWPVKDKYETTMQGGKPVHKPMFFSEKAMKSLAGFTDAADTLYVVGHGAKNTHYIADLQDVSLPYATKRTPEQLVTMLKDKLNLPQMFPGKIKILACASALASADGKSFLDAFAEVARPVFPNAHICGYLDVIFMGARTGGKFVKVQGDVRMESKPFKQFGVSAYDEAKSYEPASYHRQWRCPGGCPGHNLNYTLATL